MVCFSFPSLDVSTSKKQVDFEFLKDIVSDETTLEYSGYNTRKFREAGHTMSKATQVMYTALDTGTASVDGISCSCSTSS